MITIRKAAERGHADHGWLNTYHTFSFANYYDPRFMGFRDLRVINEDRVAPGEGFPRHPHQDMEIVSYVLAGALEHKDSMGTGSVIRPGDVQRMSAGTGVTHSEFNHSRNEELHFLQIWILPAQEGTAPSYEQKFFSPEDKEGKLRLIGSPDGRDGSVTIGQDVNLYAALVHPGDALRHIIRSRRHAWVQVAGGSIMVNGHRLDAGDGLAASEEELLEISGVKAGEILLFDLA
ncbi:pirin family protein [Geomesophilobacter sediminis]|uniref:Pirin family protein n=1 Tax=Geomesophilobacter sediminis TaxID=2798584 RepID=A0A8J7LY88_9BACT|nr:pirin family protein [Geomesophilobacter sediminis]MBJ6724576.1 pirin family protein [Geomesophilobacter sediminis]